MTLDEAIAAAMASAPVLAATRADSAIAHAQLSLARAFPDPALTLGYSESPPIHHAEVEQPLEYPWVRSVRIRSARRSLDAAHLLADVARADVWYRVEAAYAQAAGASQIHELSRRNEESGQELVRSVRARLDAGDASELDVELAEVTRGQLHGAALADSLQALQATLALQALMGLPVDRVVVQPADSLSTAPVLLPPSARAGLRVAAAEQQLAAQEAGLLLARRSRVPAPVLRAGIEQGDPSGGERGVLPTVGVSIPVPLFGGGGAEVSRARAAQERARAEVAAARQETAVALATADQARRLALARLESDTESARHAERVAELSATAYREGAYPLASVLEAQRNARDALRQYLEDLVARRTTEAAYRLALTAGGGIP